MNSPTGGRLHLEHFVGGQLESWVCEHTAVNQVLEEKQGLYSVTEQVLYSYALGQKRNRVVFKVSSILLVLNEGHDRLPSSVFANSRDDDFCYGCCPLVQLSTK